MHARRRARKGVGRLSFEKSRLKGRACPPERGALAECPQHEGSASLESTPAVWGEGGGLEEAGKVRSEPWLG